MGVPRTCRKGIIYSRFLKHSLGYNSEAVEFLLMIIIVYLYGMGKFWSAERLFFYDLPVNVNVVLMALGKG